MLQRLLGSAAKRVRVDISSVWRTTPPGPFLRCTEKSSRRRRRRQKCRQRRSRRDVDCFLPLTMISLREKIRHMKEQKNDLIVSDHFRCCR